MAREHDPTWERDGSADGGCLSAVDAAQPVCRHAQRPPSRYKLTRVRGGARTGQARAGTPGATFALNASQMRVTSASSTVTSPFAAFSESRKDPCVDLVCT